MSKDEIEKLMDIMQEDGKDVDINKLQQMFEESQELFDKIKYMLESDNEEEKKKFFDRLDKLRNQIESRVKNKMDSMGLTEEDVHKIMSDKSNFSEDEWEKIQEMRQGIEKQGDSLNEVLKDMNLQEPVKAHDIATKRLKKPNS